MGDQLEHHLDGTHGTTRIAAKQPTSKGECLGSSPIPVYRDMGPHYNQLPDISEKPFCRVNLLNQGDAIMIL